MRSPAPVALALAYLGFVSLGLPDTVIGVAWPSVRSTFGLSQPALGATLAAATAGYFTSSLAAGRAIARLGTGTLLAASTALVAIALAGQAAAPAWGAFVALALAFGLGSGAIDAGLNAHAAAHFPVRHVNWLHACYSLGATAGPVVMTAVLAAPAPWRAGYGGLAAALGALAAAFLAARARLDVEPAAARSPSARAARAGEAGARAALRAPVVRLQVAVFLVYTGVEAAAGQWCFTVLTESRGLPLEEAGAWTSAYWGAILAGRVLAGAIAPRVDPDALVRTAVLAAAGGAALFALAPGLAGRLGLVLLGLALAPVYPTLVARTPARTGALSAHAVGFQVGAAQLGAGVLPALAGLAAGGAGLEVVPAVVLAAAVLLAVLHEALLSRARVP